MEAEFWHARWREGRIGFHEGKPNRMLERYAGLLAGRARVLVPLCGKADDLAFLASAGHEVVGVELVESAVRDFFVERGLTPSVREVGPFRAYSAGRVTLYAGDFFAATRELLGPLDALYDRAALIALPEPMRRAYAEALRGLMPAGALGLLVTIDYAEGGMEGPPFSIPEAHLRELYAGITVEPLETVNAVDARLASIRGRECTWLVHF